MDRVSDITGCLVLLYILSRKRKYARIKDECNRVRNLLYRTILSQGRDKRDNRERQTAGRLKAWLRDADKALQMGPKLACNQHAERKISCSTPVGSGAGVPRKKAKGNH